ncbi:MAG: hypothetical protein CM15mP49_01900 [Actinomycetota bacterium]|nr:MAG: hypothetical protein CM15mP49_01900 [Actinomycetota bacterium]
MEGSDLEGLTQILGDVNIPVIASGGLGSIKDFYDLVGLQVNGSKLAGVITGRALYEKCLDLRELISITEDPEHVELNMTNVRIIPCLDVTDGRVVKGTNFVDLKDAGDPVELASKYDQEGADEIVF